MALQEALFHQLHGLSPHLRLMYISNNMKEKLFKRTVLSYTHSWIIHLLCALYIQIVFAHYRVYSTWHFNLLQEILQKVDDLPLSSPLFTEIGLAVHDYEISIRL